MKVVDTRAYVGALRELTEAGHEVNMVIAGNSMMPFLIHQRDVIWFRKPDSPLKRGDMVFYQRLNGDFVMHRVWRVAEEGIYTVGDGQFQIEGPLQPQQVFARVTRVERKGKTIAPGSFWWWFFARVWLHIPLRRPLYKLYLLLRHPSRAAQSSENTTAVTGTEPVAAAKAPASAANSSVVSETQAAGHENNAASTYTKEEGRDTHGKNSAEE